MKAVDTNIIVRLMVMDQAEQAAIARRVVAGGVFVPITVMLEAGWILAGPYRKQRGEIAAALVELLDIPTVHVAEEASLRQAIELFREGADLADAIHLVSAGGSEAFVTFDRRLARLTDTSICIELAD